MTHGVLSGKIMGERLVLNGQARGRQKAEFPLPPDPHTLPHEGVVGPLSPVVSCHCGIDFEWGFPP